MKTNKIASIVLLTALFTGACKQQPIVPVAPTPPVTETPSKGNADFTKFVALGDSYVAGAQGGTLFNASLTNSIPKILSTQFATVGGGAFNQPDVNHENGLNFAVFAASGGTVSLGRYVLFDPDGDFDPDGPGCATSRSAAPRAAGTPLSPAVCPSTSTTPAMPAPYDTYQTLGSLLGFAGDKAALNNFGVPGTRVFHTTAAAYGAAPPTGSPWYFRFASAPGTSTLLGDAASKGHKFFLLSMGLFDILSYATAGGAGNPNGIGSADMTPEAAVFTPSYNANLSTMLTDPSTNGVVTTIPDITTLPFFFAVTWNAVEFKSTNCSDAATIAGLNGLFSGYNAALDGLLLGGYPGLTAEEVAKRKVSYKYGKNPVVISDEGLTDLGAALGGISPALAQFGRTRPATSTDLILLTAGSVLGTCAPSPPTGVPATSWIWGVSAPLTDQLALIPTEIADIQARTVLFNTKIKEQADLFPGRVAVADLYQAYKELVTNKAYAADGVTIVPSFAPPAGMFSEDGIHPNSRGNAFTANVIIDAINAKFAAKVPKASLANFSGTGLPVKGQ
ncbi:MAG: hypothetical protein JNL40_04120 [Cyclobacteriaceae bacterium]|nr:hypothetical protein [Cyclobacteriaceae bacterium]